MFQLKLSRKKNIKLLDLYEVEILDKIIKYAIENNKLDIKSIKQLIKNDFFKIIDGSNSQDILKTTDIENNKDCDYCENPRVVQI